MDINKIVAQRLNDLRIDTDMTQEKLGEVLKVSRTQAANYETGESEWTVTKLDAVCQHFGKTPNHFMGYDDLPRNGSMPLVGLTEDQVELLHTMAAEMRKQNEK